jgi:hypothetical protein
MAALTAELWRFQGHFAEAANWLHHFPAARAVTVAGEIYLHTGLDFEQKRNRRRINGKGKWDGYQMAAPKKGTPLPSNIIYFT